MLNINDLDKTELDVLDDALRDFATRLRTRPNGSVMSENEFYESGASERRQDLHVTAMIMLRQIQGKKRRTR